MSSDVITETKRSFSVDIEVTGEQYEIIEQAAKYEELPVETFLGDMLQIYLGGNLHTILGKFLDDIWEGNLLPVSTKPEAMKKSGTRSVTVLVKGDEAVIRALNLIEGLTKQYEPTFFEDSVIAEMEAHLRYEKEEDDRIPEDVAKRLYAQWQKTIGEDED